MGKEIEGDLSGKGYQLLDAVRYNDSGVKEGRRLSELQVDRNKESIFGIDVGICALHEGRGVRVPEGSQRASAVCASLHGTISIGAWKDVMCIFAVGAEGE